MPSFFRPCILAAMVCSSLIACDEESSDTDPIELRASPPTACAIPTTLRELQDPDDLIFVDDFEVHVLVDPASAPMDISTGVIDGAATVVIDGPYGTPLKIKLKITVMPAGPTGG